MSQVNPASIATSGAGLTSAPTSPPSRGHGLPAQAPRANAARVILWRPVLASAGLFVVLTAASIFLAWEERHDVKIARNAHNADPSFAARLEQLEQSKLPLWTIWIGVAVSFIASAALFRGMILRARDRLLTREHVAALERLNEISAAISASRASGDDVMMQLAAAARQLLGMPKSSYARLSDDDQVLEIRLLHGFPEMTEQRTFPVSETPGLRACLQSGDVMAIGDLHQNPGPFNPAKMNPFKLGAIMLIPLKVEGRWIGMISLADHATHQFDDRDLRLARLIGSQASVIVANARLYAEMQTAISAHEQLAGHQTALWQISTAMQQAQTVDAALRQLADLAPAALGVDQCAIGLAREDPSEILVSASTAGSLAASLPANTTARCNLCAGVLRTAQSRVLESTADDPDFRHDFFPGTGSALYVPMLNNDGRAIGLLALFRKKTGPFTAAQVQMAELLARPAATMIENIRLHAETRAALEGQKKLLNQRESLYALNTFIYQSRDLSGALQRITDTAPEVLGIDFCSIVLTTDTPDDVEIAAATHPINIEHAGRRISIRGDRGQRTFASGQIEIIDDASIDPTLHPEWRIVPGVRSIGYVPLFRSDGQPLGIFSIVRYQPGGFTNDQLDLSRVFATRAAAAIENARLHQQTRRDAEAKALLLRELNHRVKNNLAGIVALLTLDEPDMPPRVRQWMDRVVDRIKTMSRTHDLFSGGIERVSMSELIEQALLSVSVVKPPGVTFRQDLDGVNVMLRTDRAVTVAMVLHELCYNALVHGVPDGGSVSICARRGDDSRIAISVMDDGQGCPSHAEKSDAAFDAAAKTAKDSGNGGGRGQGLMLVRGLVGRELRGQFQLRSGMQGGTIATVEFPLLAEESEVLDGQRV